jgi:hypothetical protein
MTRVALFIVGLLAAASAAAQDMPPVPKFADETSSSGLTSTFTGEWLYMVGGGVGVFDCNGDRLPEIILSGGVAKATFFRNASQAGGALQFVAEASGLELDKVLGVYPIDVDGDGNVDVVLLRQGENVVMRGLGGCRFERANEAWNFTGGNAWSASFAATWEKGANWPTLAVGNYIDRNDEFSPWGSCTDNWLHRPVDAEQNFAPPLALKPSFCPLSMLFTDWSRSGQPSLRVSNDREYYEGGQEQMWRVGPGHAPALYGKEDGWAYVRIWGMGIATSDINNDRYPDYFLTSMADQRLQMLKAPPTDGSPPKPTYGEFAWPMGVTAHRPYTGDDERPSTGWHAQFADVNNDGFDDLFVVKGNVWEMPDFATRDPNNLLLQKPDNKFVEVGDRAGVASMRQGRGGAVADLNNDGLLDIVVVNRNEPAEVWRNVSDNAGKAVSFELAQPGPNRNAIGAWIEVKCGDRLQQAQVTIGGGHAGGQLLPRHFGLASEKAAQVRVIWPNGAQSEWFSVESGKTYRLEPGQPPQVL